MREEKLKEYLRNWTEEQFDDAERVGNEITARFGEEMSLPSLIVLVVEERKRDPNTTVECAMSLALLLGVESLFGLRRVAQNRSGCIVSPDVAKARTPRKRRKVRGV